MKTSREMMLALHGSARAAALNRLEPFVYFTPLCAKLRNRSDRSSGHACQLQ
jgi:hypothetical protein